MTNTDGSLFGSGTFYITEDTTTSLTMNSLVTSCFNELNARYAEIRDIPSSHQEAIAWTVNDNDYTMSWNAKDYAPDLELSITSDNTPELVVNGSSIGPWYSKDCVYHDEVYIDTSNFTIGIRGYDVVPFTIPRGKYTAVEIVNMIADVINEMCVSFSIGQYLVYVSVQNGGSIRMGCRNGAVPRFIFISENPFIQITPGPYAEPGGIYLNCTFTFYRNWYIRMPELTTPYDFALAVYNGLSEANLENGYTYSNRETTISFNQPARVYFASPVTLLGDSPLQPLASFVEWEQPQSYTVNTTIRFPYGVMTLDDTAAETDITYTDDVQTFTWTIPSRLTQADLVWRMNQCFDSAALNIQWIPESDGYYIHADYVFSLSGNLGTIIPASGSQSHTWRIPFDDGVYYANYGPMVGEYPVDITNGLSNIRLYCNIVKSKTIPLLANVPMDSLYKNYFYKNRMLIPCSELLDRIEYELKDENDEALSFIGNIYLLIGFTVINNK